MTGSSVCPSCHQLKRSAATSVDGLCDSCAGRQQPSLPGMDRSPPRAPPERRPYDDSASGYVGPGAYHNRTETSKRAAEEVLPKISKRERRVWEWIHARGGKGSTIDECSEETGMLVASVCPVFYHLRKLGKLIKVDETRPTRSGRAARVHVVYENLDDV